MAKRISDCPSSFFSSSLPVVVGLEMVVGATMAAEEEEEAEATEDVDVRVGVGCGDEDGDTTLVNDIVGSTDVGQISNASLYQVIE